MIMRETTYRACQNLLNLTADEARNAKLVESRSNEDAVSHQPDDQLLETSKGVTYEHE